MMDDANVWVGLCSDTPTLSTRRHNRAQRAKSAKSRSITICPLECYTNVNAISFRSIFCTVTEMLRATGFCCRLYRVKEVYDVVPRWRSSLKLSKILSMEALEM